MPLLGSATPRNWQVHKADFLRQKPDLIMDADCLDVCLGDEVVKPRRRSPHSSMNL